MLWGKIRTVPLIVVSDFPPIASFKLWPQKWGRSFCAYERSIPAIQPGKSQLIGFCDSVEKRPQASLIDGKNNFDQVFLVCGIAQRSGINRIVTCIAA
jgi:hypothetical protein